MITPVVLTYNEESNLEKTLASLSWASRVVILDSGSDDQTELIARSFRNVDWFVRRFDNHASQWRYAVQKTFIDTEYVLALDADMRPSPDFVPELETFIAAKVFAGAWIAFDYITLGRSLSSSIYPAQVRIFKSTDVCIEQPGHTQIFSVSGQLYRFRSRFIHDDRKPIDRWLSNQIKYASLEASRINSEYHPGVKDRLRLFGISPFVWGIWAYLRAGGPIHFSSSRAYAYERIIFESILCRLLAEKTNYLPREPKP